MNASRLRPVHVAALVLGLAAAGCGPSPGASSPDVSAQAIAGVDARLHGPWRLAKFTPETPLEPMLEALVQFQYSSMVVRFDKARMRADSPGVHIDRAYRISEVMGDRFKLTSYDEQGVPYDTACNFVDGSTVEVVSMTPPWRGVAILRRAPAQEMAPGAR
jgi:hypothetical protein